MWKLFQLILISGNIATSSTTLSKNENLVQCNTNLFLVTKPSNRQVIHDLCKEQTQNRFDKPLM